MAGDHRASQSPMLFLPQGELNGTGHKFEIMNCLASPGGMEGAEVCVHRGAGGEGGHGTVQRRSAVRIKLGMKKRTSLRGGHGWRGLATRRRGALIAAAGRVKSAGGVEKGESTGEGCAVSFSVEKPLSLAS